VIPQVITLMNFICSKVCSRIGLQELKIWAVLIPMVTKSGMGSGLITNRKNQSYSSRKHTRNQISSINENAIGYESPQEIIDVLPILDKYPLKKI
jgi:hypothetical protein